MKAFVNNWLYGQISPKMAGRLDSEVFNKGCEVLKNMVVMKQGGVKRRPPLHKVVADSTEEITTDCVLIPYSIDVVRSYVLCMTTTGFHVYHWVSSTKKLDRITTGLVSYPTVDGASTAFSYSGLDAINKAKYAQYYNDLYIVSEEHPVMRITVSSSTVTCTFPRILTNGDVPEDPRTDEEIEAGVELDEEYNDDEYPEFNLNKGTGNYATAIGIIKEKMWLASTTNHPYTLWVSRPYGASQMLGNYKTPTETTPVSTTQYYHQNINTKRFEKVSYESIVLSRFPYDYFVVSQSAYFDMSILDFIQFQVMETDSEQLKDTSDFPVQNRTDTNGLPVIQRDSNYESIFMVSPSWGEFTISASGDLTLSGTATVNGENTTVTRIFAYKTTNPTAELHNGFPIYYLNEGNTYPTTDLSKSSRKLYNKTEYIKGTKYCTKLCYDESLTEVYAETAYTSAGIPKFDGITSNQVFIPNRVKLYGKYNVTHNAVESYYVDSLYTSGLDIATTDWTEMTGDYAGELSYKDFLTNQLYPKRNTSTDVIYTYFKLVNSAEVNVIDGYPYQEYDLSDSSKLINKTKVVNRMATSSTGMEVQFASGRQDKIKWMNINDYIFVGTESGEWRLPTSINAIDGSADMYSSYGSSCGLSTRVNQDIIFIGRNNNLRLLYHDYYGTQSLDLSVTNPEIIDGDDIICMVSKSVPEPMVYILQRKLVSDAYVYSMKCISIDRANSIQGWCEFDFGNSNYPITIKSITVVEDDKSRVLIALCNKGNNYWLAYLDEDEESSFKDQKYETSSVDSNNYVDYDSILTTFPYDISTDSGTTFGSYKNIGKMIFRCYKTGHIRTYTKSSDSNKTLNEVASSGLGDYSININGGSMDNLRVTVKAFEGEPMNLLAVAYEMRINNGR